MKMEAGQCFLLVILVSISLLSLSQASFSDVIQHYKKTTLCPTKKLIQNGDIQCHMNGVPVIVEDFLQTGTICDIAYSHRSQRLLCENSIWHNFGDTSVHRRKRFVGWVFAAIVVCILFCKM